VDTLRIRVQTWPGKVVPPLHELVPRPRVRTLYAGLPVALGFSVPALSIYLSTYEGTYRSQYDDRRALTREGSYEEVFGGEFVASTL
jgi:hypothetical protein